MKAVTDVSTVSLWPADVFYECVQDGRTTCENYTEAGSRDAVSSQERSASTWWRRVGDSDENAVGYSRSGMGCARRWNGVKEGYGGR